MNENASLTNLVMRVNAKERLRRTEVSRRNTRERKLVGFGEMVQRLATEDEETRMEIERFDIE